MHFIGLSDRYVEGSNTGEIKGGNDLIEKSDIMAYGPRFSSRPMTMSPLHYQNFKNYLIDPPQAQQQYNQSNLNLYSGIELTP